MDESEETNKTTNVLGDAWVMKYLCLSSDDPFNKPRLLEHFDYYPCAELLQKCLSLNLNRKSPLEMECLKNANYK